MSTSTLDPTVRPTPVWAVQVFSFLCSIGTGLVTNGVFYLTETSYGFTRLDNLWLAVVLGVTYIAGAKAAGPGVRALRRAMPRLGSRGVLVGMMALMAALLVVPSLVSPGQWVVWMLILGYTPLTGVLWPMVESFLSGGRSGHTLRAAIGSWNVIWAGALLVPFLGLGALVEGDPSKGFLGLAVVHVVSAGVLLLFFQRDPAPHVAEHHDPHPPVYTQLLFVFRMLLPMGYFVFSALNPILASLMGTMGVAPVWRPALAATWLASRTVTFAILGRWHGWHGTWGFPIAGAVAILGGFTMAVLSPLLGAGALPVAIMTLGLAIFGIGMGMVYSGAIYYAMEVGKAEVDAGGTHEALVGLGYVAGPGCGLVAFEIVRQGVPAPFEAVVLSIVGAIALAVGIYAIAHARAKSRTL